MERDASLALLLLDNPRQRNALSLDMLSQLKTWLVQLACDEEIGAVVVGSAVQGVFASGGDINELRALAGSRGGLEFAKSVQAVFQLIEEFPRPVLAAINGYCLGAGAELAAAADIRIAADTAQLAFPQVGLGILPGLGGGQRLVRLTRPGTTKRLVFTGERISAQDAWSLGFVEFLVPASQLWDTAKELAGRLASKPRQNLILAKRAVNYSAQANLVAGCAYEASLFGLACALPEYILRTSDMA